MITSKKFGNQGENEACSFLLSKGYQILHRNYRNKRAEIDIIARINEILVFIEVKTRRSNTFGYPEESVNERKQELFLETAEAYIEKTGWQHDIRFDIIAITSSGKDAFQVHHIEDAFY